MIVLTDCLTEQADEGCVKVATNLVKRLKRQCPDMTVITYGVESRLSDLHLKLNPLFLNGSLLRLLRRKREPVLYIPFSSNTKAAVLRTWLLTKRTGAAVNVLFMLYRPMDRITRSLLRGSGARVFCLSADAYGAYRDIVGDRAVRLKTGVDTSRFVPVDAVTKACLRQNFGIHPGKKVLLHVGHLKEERGLRQLLSVGQAYHVVLVTSPRTETEQSRSLRRALEARPNTTILDAFLPHIQQIYQMADVFFFPKCQPGNCIDLPLSVLEAAACNLPVVAGQCSQLWDFFGEEGFYFMDTPDLADTVLDRAAVFLGNARCAVLPYDWSHGAKMVREVCGA